MTIDIALLGVLADPIDKEPLLWQEDQNRLYNPRAHRAYSLRHGIPVLLAAEAIHVDDPEHQLHIARTDTEAESETA